MTLYEMLLCGMAHQKYHVYETNIYDQNIALGHGPRKQIMDEYDAEAECNRPYNCLTGDKHFWLFDELKKEVTNAQANHP